MEEMEDFWQGMKVLDVRREKDNLLICDEKFSLPLAEKFILECSSTDYLKDINLGRNEVKREFLEKIILGQNVLLGMRYNKERKRYEIIQIALFGGWCWDES